MLQYTAVRALDVAQLLPVRLVYDQEASKWATRTLRARGLQRAELNHQLAVAPPTLRAPNFPLSVLIFRWRSWLRV